MTAQCTAAANEPGVFLPLLVVVTWYRATVIVLAAILIHIDTHINTTALLTNNTQRTSINETWLLLAKYTKVRGSHILRHDLLP